MKVSESLESNWAHCAGKCRSTRWWELRRCSRTSGSWSFLRAEPGRNPWAGKRAGTHNVRARQLPELDNRYSCDEHHELGGTHRMDPSQEPQSRSLGLFLLAGRGNQRAEPRPLHQMRAVVPHHEHPVDHPQRHLHEPHGVRRTQVLLTPFRALPSRRMRP